MTLDNPVLASRRRTTYARRSSYERRALMPVRPRTISDVMPFKPVAKSVKPAGQTHSPRLSHSQVLKREAIKRKPIVRRRRSSLKSRLLSGMAIMLFIFGVGVGLSGLRSNHKVEAQVQHLSQQTSAVAGAETTTTTDVPSENKPSGSLSSYHVAASLPRALTIAKLGVQARILRTTAKANNELGTPPNIFDTAWYDGSAKPGEAGAVLIDGHVSGPTRHGVFYDLKKLKPGDKIQVERGDGKTYTYSVVTAKVYDASNVDMAAAVNPVTAGKAGLNLMTCTGQVDSSGNHFKQRLIVFAAQD